MGNLYFLEKMMIEQMREMQRQAEFRTRLGSRHWRAQPTPRCLRQLVGGWLIRAGFRLQGGNPDLDAVIGQIMGRAVSGAAYHGGQNGRITDSR